jgi:uncharacterized protein
MAAVSDSSPLIAFSAIGRLDLLQALFTELIVPPAVWREVVTESGDKPGGGDVLQAGWIVRRALPQQRLPRSIAALDPGEAEAIALASSMQPSMEILLDDSRARQVARTLGLNVVGSGGALLLAKDAGLIAAVRPMLFDLRAAGLYLGDRALRELLTLAGEP